MPGARGRPAMLSRDAIEQAVIDVGFDAATTTAIAAHLGVDQSSLYRHIATKDQMIAAAASRVILAAQPPENAETWQDYLRDVAETIWQLLRSHPGLTARLIELDIVSPGSIQLMRRTVRQMMRFGWTITDAVLVIDSLSDMTADAVSAIEARERSDRLNASDLAEQIGELFLSLPDDSGDGLNIELAAYLTDMMNRDPKCWWQRKVELIIAGAERLTSTSKN